MNRVVIEIGEYVIHSELKNTPTAKALYAHAPFQSSAQTRGNEVYFATPVSNIALEDDAKDVVELGELAFWVEGSSIAIGYGPTPISHNDEIRLAAKTNIWGHTTNDLKILKNVCPRERIKVIALEK